MEDASSGCGSSAPGSAGLSARVRLLYSSPQTAGSLALRSMYRSTANVWQTLNVGKAPGVSNNLIIFGAVHGQMSRHCLGVVCQTLPVLRYQAVHKWRRGLPCACALGCYLYCSTAAHQRMRPLTDPETVGATALQQPTSCGCYCATAAHKVPGP